MIDLPVMIIGAGGHAKVLIEALQKQSINMIGLTDANESLIGESILGVRVIGNDDEILKYKPDHIRLVNGIGSIHDTIKRTKIYQNFKLKGYSFATVIHPSAIIANDVHLSEGVQAMAGAIIQPGCFIDENTIINTKASIDHDCKVASHVHLAPGVTISGAVEIGEGTHIGTGASVIQGVVIGRQCTIGAGAVVIGNIDDGAKAIGVPAKEVMR